MMNEKAHDPNFVIYYQPEMSEMKFNWWICWYYCAETM
jgi:hypothetical protein